jgi:hypothetical protein
MLICTYRLMCTYMYVYQPIIDIWEHLWSPSHLRVLKVINVSIHIYEYIRTRIRTYIRTHICTHADTLWRAYIHLTDRCAYIYIYIHIHTCIHTYMLPRIFIYTMIRTHQYANMHGYICSSVYIHVSNMISDRSNEINFILHWLTSYYIEEIFFFRWVRSWKPH